MSDFRTIQEAYKKVEPISEKLKPGKIDPREAMGKIITGEIVVYFSTTSCYKIIWILHKYLTHFLSYCCFITN